MSASRFHWVDYLVFGLSLVVSTLVGLFYGCTGRGQPTTEEFLMAGRSMGVFPVSVSLFVSWLSAISILGDPVEAYTYGAIYWFQGVGYALSIPLVAHFFAPFFHQCNIVSAYEFLETRFNVAFRLFGTITCLFVTVSWLAIVLYAPALALSQASGVTVWVSIVSIAAVCTFYTTLGGMRAVLWADTIQMAVMVAGLLAIVIQGSIKAGGVARVWEIAARGGRINFWNMDPSPFIRSSFWVFLVGGFFRIFNPFISAQYMIQRYSTVRTPREATLVVYLTMPMFLVAVTLFTAIGLLMHAVYHDCDPLLDGRIERRDQMVPLFVLELLGFLPGIPGLFVACVFSASLSSLSSGINSLAAITLQDIIAPIYLSWTKVSLDDAVATNLAKMLAVLYGAVITASSFLILGFGSSIFAMASKVVGMTGSPLAGVFFIGILAPNINSTCVMVGFSLSLCLCLWLGLGAMFLPPRMQTGMLVMPDFGCTGNNESLDLSPTTTNYLLSHAESSTSQVPTMEDATIQLEDFYQLTPLYYAALGCLSTVGLTLLAHAFTVLVKRFYSKGNEERTIINMQMESQALKGHSLPAVDDSELSCLDDSEFNLLGEMQHDDSPNHNRQNSTIKVKKRETDEIHNCR